MSPMLPWWINSGILVAVRGARDSLSAVSRPFLAHVFWDLKEPLYLGLWWTKLEKCEWQALCLITGHKVSSPTSFILRLWLWMNMATLCIIIWTEPTNSCRKWAILCSTSLCPVTGISGIVCLCNSGAELWLCWISNNKTGGENGAHRGNTNCNEQ